MSEDVANLRKTHFAKVEILQLSPWRTKDVFLDTVEKRCRSIRTGNHVEHALTPDVTSDLVSAPERHFGSGLGLLGEQGGELIHAKFKVVFVWDASGIGIGDFAASAFVWSE